MGTVEKKLIYRDRKGFNDVKKYVKTINPDLPDQVTQKGYFKDTITEWKEGGYSAEDRQAWNVYARANRIKASGINMFSRFRLVASVEEKTWQRLSNCIIYDVVGTSFKVDINVGADYSGRLYYGTSKLYMKNEVVGVFSVDKYTFDVTGLTNLTNYYFYIKNTAIGEEGRTGIYGQKTPFHTPVDIYMGEDAIYRFQSMGGYTTVNKGNPANASGKITSVEIFCKEQLLNCKVATFFVVSGNFLSTRGWANIGNVASGSKQTISGLDIDVQAGDYIGIAYDDGSMRRDWSGFGGHWYTAPNKIPCVNIEFTFLAGDAISLCGKGVG